ncbi:hypothetical protein DBR06_SOUSAS6510028, partial [Sousa chinensis]
TEGFPIFPALTRPFTCMNPSMFNETFEELSTFVVFISTHYSSMDSLTLNETQMQLKNF